MTLTRWALACAPAVPALCAQGVRAEPDPPNVRVP